MSKILIGSPVRQKPQILEQFLKGLEMAQKGDNDLTYYFVDDNTDSRSSSVLKDFSTRNNHVLIRKPEEVLEKTDDNQYICDDFTHNWNAENIDRISSFKDEMINYCIDNDYDYLFLIDSDIVLDMRSLLHLIARNVEIVSNVFYSQWEPNEPLLPQCFWIPSVFQREKSFRKPLSYEEAMQIRTDLYAKIRVPGIYKVEGLGACTLIKSSALKKGVRFQKIPNVSMFGEDRHFCIRAGVAGIDLYIDSVYPAYHIYRKEYLSRVDEFLENGFSFDMCRTDVVSTNKKTESCPDNPLIDIPKRAAKKVYRYYMNRKEKKEEHRKRERYLCGRDTGNKSIVLQMIVHNETGRYLERCLQSVIDIVDFVVVIDDASTDGTAELCEQLLKDHPHVIIKNKSSLFHEEYKLRKMLWDETVKHDPGWIMSLDADEVLPDNANTIRDLVNNDDVDGFSFKLYDMWNEYEYREDEYWHPHKVYYPFLMRYIKGCNYQFKQTNQHCGRFPVEYYQYKYANINLRIKHYGWADEKSRKQKYDRYMSLDPKGEFGVIEQYQSILDPNPKLKRFSDLPKGIE
jgi:glycosyltransferase involved in cell wall biosynthesis